VRIGLDQPDGDTFPEPFAPRVRTVAIEPLLAARLIDQQRRLAGERRVPLSYPIRCISCLLSRILAAATFSSR